MQFISKKKQVPITKNRKGKHSDSNEEFSIFRNFEIYS